MSELNSNLSPEISLQPSVTFLSCNHSDVNSVLLAQLSGRIILPLGVQSLPRLHEERDSIPPGIVDKKCCCSKCWSYTVFWNSWVVCITDIRFTAFTVALVLAHDYILQLQWSHRPQHLHLVIGHTRHLSNKNCSSPFTRWINT